MSRRFAMKALAGAILFLALAASAGISATKDAQPPNREMLKMMEFLRHMEMIKQMEMLQDMQRLEDGGAQSRSTPPPASPQQKKQESAK